MTAARHGTAFGVVRALRAGGVERVFFVTGGDQPLWIALKEEGMELSLARSEASAVAMADGYSRTTGRPSLVYGQWGPGASNVAAALADAYWSRSPVVALTTSVATTGEGRFAYQELDQLPLFASVTKWNRRVPSLARAAEFASIAVQASLSGCPGPVHLDIPKDWLASEEVPAAGPPRSPASRPAPSTEAVDALVAALHAAGRPVLLAGAGVLFAAASEPLIQVAEAWGLPVVTSMGGKGAIGESHANAVGVTGRYSRKVANDVVAQADLVVAVGTDLGGMVTDDFRLPPSDAAVVQVDVDASNLGVSHAGTVPIMSDAAELLSRLASAAPADAASGERADWLASVRSEVSTWREELRRAEAEAGDGVVGHEAVLARLRKVAHPADLLVADTGFTGAWAGALWMVPEPGRYFLRAAGTLGWAFPAALGAQAGLPERRAICLIGDGGMGYNLGDLETARRLELPVVTVVLNNDALAYEYLVQKVLYDTVVPEVNDFAEIDYAAIARAAGVDGYGAASVDELDYALERAFERRRPALIDVRVSSERPAPTTTFESKLDRVL